MHNLYTALTGLNTDQGIKNINIFYDTLFLNVRTIDEDNSTNPEYLIIQKLNYDFVNYELTSNNNNLLISFGDAGFTDPSQSNGNVFVDNILLEKSKKVIICGLEKIGSSFIPSIHLYDINDNTLTAPYNYAVDDWSSLSMGQFKSSQYPLVSFNTETNILNYIFVTYTTGKEYIFDIEFKFEYDIFKLNKVRKLEMSDTNSSNYKLVKFKNYNTDDKLLMVLLNNKKVVPLVI